MLWRHNTMSRCTHIHTYSRRYMLCTINVAIWLINDTALFTVAHTCTHTHAHTHTRTHAHRNPRPSTCVRKHPCKLTYFFGIKLDWFFYAFFITTRMECERWLRTSLALNTTSKIFVSRTHKGGQTDFNFRIFWLVSYTNPSYSTQHTAAGI